MFSKSFVSCWVLGLLTLQGVAQTTGVGLWSFFGGPAFTDADSVGLVGADPATNPGDGDMIVLGYFDGITSAVDVTGFGASEWGSFTPLIGPDSIYNSHILAQVGPLAGSLGYFTLSINFDPNGGETLPVGYDTYRLGVRFYDSNTMETSTNYNTVTSNDGAWFLPTVNTPASPNPTLNFEVPTNLVFEGTPYMTDIPLAPEPSSTLLVLLASSLWIQRRRPR